MKSLSSTLMMLFLLLMFSHAQSQIYSWVDKEGKKHFSETVPAEYLDQATELQLKPINSIDTTDIPSSSQEEPYTQEPQKKSVQPQVVQITKKISDCEQQKRAYDESAKCYLKCRRVLGDKEHPIYNVAKCDHCADVKKPSCD